jgi:dipeptidyl aminopeptidase/acylaminoacyl peptidase
MTDAKVGWSSRDMDKAISLEAAPKRTICSPVSNGFGTRWSTDSGRTADPCRRFIAMQVIQTRLTLRGMAAALIICSVSIVGTAEKRAMTVDDMLDLVRIDDVVMTPDGSKVFYTERRVVAYSRDRETIAFTFEDFITPADLYVAGIDGANPVRMTRANEWIERDILMPEARVVRWSSSDGTSIEGIFMLPTDRDGARLPLMLQVHGGPSGYWANAFEPDLIIYTGLGYAVLGPNVRGSSGYGDELLRGLMGDIGGGELNDLISGVDHLIDAGYVAKDRMGVAGWSWGGVLAGWVITKTDRFKAASVGAGVSNWIGESGPGYNWDISSWYIGGKHWTKRDEWRRRSAVNYVEHVNTPTLFLHGEEDQTSSTNQSMVYFDALQERGVPTRFIKFPRQKHGIREPRLLRVRIVEELRWMQKYVRGLDWIPWTRPKKDDQPERVVFHSDRDGNSEIYAISPTCADETRLTDNDSYRKSDAARFRQ